jgi:hypothetical protein
MNDEIVRRIYKKNQYLQDGRVWEFDMTKMRWVLTSRTELQFWEPELQVSRPSIGELSVRKLDL